MSACMITRKVENLLCIFVHFNETIHFLYERYKYEERLIQITTSLNYHFETCEIVTCQEHDFRQPNPSLLFIDN